MDKPVWTLVAAPVIYCCVTYFAPPGPCEALKDKTCSSASAVVVTGETAKQQEILESLLPEIGEPPEIDEPEVSESEPKDQSYSLSVSVVSFGDSQTESQSWSSNVSEERIEKAESEGRELLEELSESTGIDYFVEAYEL